MATWKVTVEEGLAIRTLTLQMRLTRRGIRGGDGRLLSEVGGGGRGEITKKMSLQRATYEGRPVEWTS